MSEARAVLYAVRDEIIGYAENQSDKLPKSLGDIGSPVDPWGREIRYRLADARLAVAFSGKDICNATASDMMEIVTPGNETVNGTAFVLSSDGPDHAKNVKNMITGSGNVDASVSEDDLFLDVSLYHLQAVLCDPSTSPPDSDSVLKAFYTIASESAKKDGIYIDGAVINANGTISLGNPSGLDSGKSTFGCAWYNGNGNEEGITLSPNTTCTNGNCTFGSGFRAHFVFTVKKLGWSLADGFTFSVISANSNVADSCGGTGSTLGYSSTNGINTSSDQGVSPYVNPPKIGIEFDFFTSSAFNDPSDHADHLAILYWGNDGISMIRKTSEPEYYDRDRGGDDNKHYRSNLSSTLDVFTPANSGNPSPPDYVRLDKYYEDFALDERGVDSYEVRVEIKRTSNTNGTGNYTTQVWFDCQNCDDLTTSVIQDESDNATLLNSTAYSKDSMVLNSTWHAKFNKIMFGWTEGTGSVSLNATITDATFFFP